MATRLTLGGREQTGEQVTICVPKTMLHRCSASPTAFPVLASLYLPLLGSGIRSRHIAPDWTSGELTMRVAPWTANTHGTAFGGALFAATDVLYGAPLSGQLGGDYQVWTKSATIDFHRPGRGQLTCRVEVPATEADLIRDQLSEQRSTSVVHTALIVDSREKAVVEARHTMSVRRRDRPAGAPSPAPGDHHGAPQSPCGSLAASP